MQYTGFPSGTVHAEHCAMGMAERRPGKQIVVSMNPGFGDAKPGELKMMMGHMGHMGLMGLMGLMRLMGPMNPLHPL